MKAWESSSPPTHNGKPAPNKVWASLFLYGPCGTLWATCNVGANTHRECGDYFAWGETKAKANYDWENYKYRKGVENKLTKYNQNPKYGYNGYIDKLTKLQPGDDAATVNWGKGWCMPTKKQWEELIQCTKEHCFIQRNGLSVMIFVGHNGELLFLLVANDELGNAGSCGVYWSRSLYTDGPNSPIFAWYLYFRERGNKIKRDTS